jgi:hypothetical protein
VSRPSTRAPDAAVTAVHPPFRAVVSRAVPCGGALGGAAPVAAPAVAGLGGAVLGDAELGGAPGGRVPERARRPRSACAFRRRRRSRRRGSRAPQPRSSRGSRSRGAPAGGPVRSGGSGASGAASAVSAVRGSSAQTSRPGPCSWAPQEWHRASTSSSPLPCSSSACRRDDGWGWPGAQPSSRTAMRTRSARSDNSQTMCLLAVCTIALVTSSETTSAAVSQVSSHTDQPVSRARVRRLAWAGEPGWAASSNRNRRSAAGPEAAATVAAPGPWGPAAASVPKGADGITLATIAPPRTLGKSHSENCRVLCDVLDGRGTLLATARRAAPLRIGPEV